MPCPVRLYAIEDGRHRRPDLRREEVRWYSDRYPIAVEVWMLSWWNNRLSQGVVPMLLLIVHCHVCPIGGSGCRDWGSSWLLVLLEGYTCPSGEAEVSWGLGAFDDAARVHARQRNVARGAHLA
jgi:hypothetical protein